MVKSIALNYVNYFLQGIWFKGGYEEHLRDGAD